MADARSCDTMVRRARFRSHLTDPDSVTVSSPRARARPHPRPVPHVHAAIMCVWPNRSACASESLSLHVQRLATATALAKHKSGPLTHCMLRLCLPCLCSPPSCPYTAGTAPVSTCISSASHPPSAGLPIPYSNLYAARRPLWSVRRCSRIIVAHPTRPNQHARLTRGLRAAYAQCSSRPRRGRNVPSSSCPGTRSRAPCALRGARARYATRPPT